MEFRYVFLDNYYSSKNMYVLDKAWSEETLRKVCVTVVAMVTMTFQNGGYFPFKVI